MKLETYCQDAESRLRGLETTLLEFRPESMDHCQTELRKVLESLHRWMAAPGPVDAQDRQALQKVRDAARRVSALITQGTNLCLGWAQLRLLAGYTRQGRPWVIEAEAGRAIEG